MAEPKQRYVIAVKRSARGDVPLEWAEQVRSVDGLSIIGDPNQSRLLVEATVDALEQVKKRFRADTFNIEPQLVHNFDEVVSSTALPSRDTKTLRASEIEPQELQPQLLLELREQLSACQIYAERLEVEQKKLREVLAKIKAAIESL